MKKHKKKHKKQNYCSIQATNLSIGAKIVIIILVFCMFFSQINFVVFAGAFKSTYDEITTIDDNLDLSNISRLSEEEDLRTLNTKTYLKENGSLEVEYYSEAIHYLDNGVYKEIDNTLKQVNDSYINISNKYDVIFPTSINDDNEVVYNYQGNIIKIIRNVNSSNTILSNVNKNKINLKDEISYKLNSLETIKYTLSQNAIEEDVILNNYIENYEYEYYLETTLRIERVGNNLEFYNENGLVFVMDEYVMYDSLNMIIYGLNTKSYYIDRKWYGFKYYSK